MMEATAAGPTTEIRPMPMPSTKREASMTTELGASAPATEPIKRLAAVMVRLFFVPSLARMPPAGNANTTPMRENIDMTQPMAPATEPIKRLAAVMVRLFFVPSLARMPPAGNANTTPMRENIDMTQPMEASVKPNSAGNSVAKNGGALN